LVRILPRSSAQVIEVAGAKLGEEGRMVQLEGVQGGEAVPVLGLVAESLVVVDVCAAEVVAHGLVEGAEDVAVGDGADEGWEAQVFLAGAHGSGRRIAGEVGLEVGDGLWCARTTALPVAGEKMGRVDEVVALVAELEHHEPFGGMEPHHDIVRGGLLGDGDGVHPVVAPWTGVAVDAAQDALAPILALLPGEGLDVGLHLVLYAAQVGHCLGNGLLDAHGGYIHGTEDVDMVHGYVRVGWVGIEPGGVGSWRAFGWNGGGGGARIVERRQLGY